MATEGPGREDRPDDADDIDARFEEIVSGLRAEEAASQQRRREAIRRAQRQRSHNRPLEGFEDPNPWPPRRSQRPIEPQPQQPGSPEEGTNPPWSEPGDSRSPLPSSSPQHPPQRPPPQQPPPQGAGDRSPAEPAWRGWEESDEEEHFIPPTPPLPAGDLHLWAIVIGLLGGPLLLVLSAVFHVLDSGWWTALGIALAVGGVVLLFLRLPKHRDWTDSSGGAQV